MLEFHHIADSVYWSFGINELMCGCSKYIIPLKDLLGGVARGLSRIALTITAHELTH